MNNRQRRVRAIELTLTPREVVLVWLRNALQGTMEEAVRQWPPPRGAVANEVLRTVRESMKGQPDPLVERAILQARREADLLYLLVVNANTAVLEGWYQRQREYIFLLGYLSAEIRGNLTKDRVEILRLVVLTFIKPVIILDTAVAQLVTERLSQPVLFRDSEAKLAGQLQMATELSTWFNKLAHVVGVAEIDLEQLRNSVRSAAEEQIAIWEKLALVTTEDLFGSPEAARAALDQCFLLCGPNSGEPKLVEVSINTAGEITGSYIDANNVCHGFVYDAEETRTEFDAPGAGTDGERVQPRTQVAAANGVRA
jgi:hypothetical protein